MRERKTLTLSDGLEVTIEAPGIGYELEAFGTIPNLGELVRQKRRGDKEADLSPVEELRATLLAICHGAVDPQFSIDGKPGTRDVRKLLPVDVQELGGAILGLRREAMDRAEAALRPMPAAAI